MKKKINRILEFIQKNYAWIIAVITGLSVIVSNILKFIEYLTGTVYFSFYGLDMNLYRYNDKGFIYSLCISFLFIVATVCLLYCFYEGLNNLKKKKPINKNDLLIIMASNLYIIIMTNKNFNFLSVSISFIILICVEIITTFIIFRRLNNKKGKNISLRDKSINIIKNFPFLLIVLIILSGIRTQISLMYKDNYRLIDDEKVIVYSNNDYYITLDCDVNNNELIIYKGTQEKINNVGVYSKYRKFEIVNIK